MKSLLVVVALSACAPVRPYDVGAELAFSLAAVLDWGQTNGLTRQCGEGNSVIGRCGEHVAPNLYFPTIVALHAIASFVIPPGWWRTIFQGVTFGFEAKTVTRNLSLGDPLVW